MSFHPFLIKKRLINICKTPEGEEPCALLWQLRALDEDRPEEQSSGVSVWLNTWLLNPCDALWARCSAVACHLRNHHRGKALRAEWHSEVGKYLLRYELCFEERFSVPVALLQSQNHRCLMGRQRIQWEKLLRWEQLFRFFGCPSELNGESPKDISNRTYKCDLIWKEGLCRCSYVKDLEMRSSRIRWDLKSNNKSP